MSLKILGVCLIMISTVAFGFLVGATQRRYTVLMREYIRTIDYIIQELQYRRNSFSDVFAQAGAFVGGIIGKFFNVLANELEKQIAPNIQICVDVALRKVKEIPDPICNGIKLLGCTLGCFDLDGQISELERVKSECEIILNRLMCDQDIRIRNCQTLALCAGAAIVIVFI